MRHLCLLLLVSSLPLTTGFFFGGGSGSACGCAQRPACPPPPPPSPCGGARAAARGAKTMSFDQPIPAVPTYPPRVYTVPDELDLRAAAFGVPIEPQPQYSIFDILHNLGEQNGNSPAQQLVVADGSTSSDYFPKENDEDLTVSDMTGTGGLYRGKEIRRAPAEPTVHVHRDEPLPTSTISSEIVKVDTGDDTEQLDENKCNSQVLRKLMIENMNDSSSESKRNINLAAEGKFGGNVDVICSRGHFSYIFTSNLYCEATQGLTTCIAFRQSDKVRRRR